MSQPLSALLAHGPGTSQPDRAHRLLVAQRLAEAVETAHAAGGAIGNLDDHRVRVAPDGTVTLSDDAGAAAAARTPAYTAPELQGAFTGHLRPETQHDAFALAVLLFQLLMEGHHPYAGQWVGGGNLPDIPKAIQLGLYAYGGSAVTPPPGAPALSMLEPGLAELFARSFAPTSAIFRTRPTGAEWARAMATARQTEATAPPPPEPTQPAAPPEPAAGPETHVPAPAPIAAAPPAATSEAPPTAATATPTTNPALAAKEPGPPPAATPPDLVRRPQPGTSASSVKRTVPRRTAPPRAVPPDAPSGEPATLVGSDRSWWSIWSDHVGELRQLAQPGRSWSSFWRDLRAEVEAWRQVIAAIAVFLLVLIVIVLAARDDDWANPRRRPAVASSTRVPATQTPQPPPTVTRIALNNPTVASFGNNFDVSDRVIPATGERFSAYVRDKALRLEVFDKGARGKAMFYAAPAQGDFQFTVHVGEPTGQGEILLYVHDPEASRTWVFAVDPGASTWGLYEERPSSDRLKVILARRDFSSALAGQPLRTISVSRQGVQTVLLINGVAVQPRFARAMPDITGPVRVGVGAMIPDQPAYADEPFVVTVERVAMSADEA